MLLCVLHNLLALCMGQLPTIEHPSLPVSLIDICTIRYFFLFWCILALATDTPEE